MSLTVHLRSTRPALAALAATLALLIVPASPAAAADTSVFGWGAPGPIGLKPTSGAAAAVIPTTIPEAADATAAAIGQSTSLVLTPSGVLVAGNGSGFAYGLDPGPSSAIAFTPVPNTAGATAVATAGLVSNNEYGLILKADGTLLGFGLNKEGTNGVAAGTGVTNTPTPIAGLTNVTAIAAGQALAVALEADGTVWNWGNESRLGNGAATTPPTTPTTTPQLVVLPAGFKATAIVAGQNYALALGEDGSVYAWGGNANGQLGNGTTLPAAQSVNTPVQVIPPPAGGAPHVVALSAGLQSSFALYSDGSFKAWGQNTSGQLGLGSGSTASVLAPTSPTPATVAARPDRYPPLAQIRQVGNTTYAIVGGSGASKGQVFVWGDNPSGQFGFGTGASTYSFNFPYTGAAGTPSQGKTEIPQRLGRLKGVPWLGAGVNGTTEIAPSEPTLRVNFHGNPAFFSHPIGTVSAPQSEIFESPGDPTTVTSIRVRGPNASDFTVIGYRLGNNNGDLESLPLTISATGSLEVLVRFNPSGAGERFATLKAEGNGEAASIQLSGFGTDLPGNTPGPEGKTGPAGPAGTAGPAGRDGVVVFAATRSQVRARRGGLASLRFLLLNGTTARLTGTTVDSDVPRRLGKVRGDSAVRIAPLAAGASRRLAVPVRIGDRAKLGSHTVTVEFRAGSKIVRRSVGVRVVP